MSDQYSDNVVVAAELMQVVACCYLHKLTAQYVIRVHNRGSSELLNELTWLRTPITYSVVLAGLVLEVWTQHYYMCKR